MPLKTVNITTTAMKKNPKNCWTYNPKSRRTNDSELFHVLVDDVKSMILGSGSSLIRGNAESVARLIVAQLAHVYGLRPPKVR